MMIARLQKQLDSPERPLQLDLELEIDQGSLLALTGPSGSGKTSLLRLLAGLSRADKGYIRFGEHQWLDTSLRIDLPPQKRNIGFVFQNYALFPNMSVRQNLRFALRKNDSPQIVEELIDIMELGPLIDRHPPTLSGGQQQRVALARALVRRPPLLLLDEPLSALDLPMRLRLQDYILQLHRKYQLTTLLVTHDYAEMRKMADRIGLLQNGRLRWLHSPDELLSTTPPSNAIPLQAKVLSTAQQGDITWLEVQIGDNTLSVQLPTRQAQAYGPGSDITLWSSGLWTLPKNG